jgi:hypothetical protein
MSSSGHIRDLARPRQGEFATVDRFILGPVVLVTRGEAILILDQAFPFAPEPPEVETRRVERNEHRSPFARRGSATTDC